MLPETGNDNQRPDKETEKVRRHRNLIIVLMIAFIALPLFLGLARLLGRF